MKNNLFTYTLLAVSAVGIVLYIIGSQTNGTWKESILLFAAICLVVSALFTFLIVLDRYVSSKQEEV